MMTKEELREAIYTILSTEGVDLGNVTGPTPMALGQLFNRYMAENMNAKKVGDDWAECITSVCAELQPKEIVRHKSFRTS